MPPSEWKLLAEDESIGGPVEVFADSAYGTGDALDALDRAGHLPVIEPWPLRPAVAGGFTLDDFTVDEVAGTKRAHRARAADPGFQATFRRHRPMVERSLAWLNRGNRRVPYRGVDKNAAWLHLRVAAIDLRRLLSLGLTGTAGQWHWPLDQRHPHRPPWTASRATSLSTLGC
jgi:Transposase DDE domain